MTKILCQWELAGYHTLSTVPLGIGRMYGYDQKEVAYEMLNCCYRHFKKRTSSSSQVILVLTIFTKSVYLTFESFFHTALNLFYFGKIKINSCQNACLTFNVNSYIHIIHVVMLLLGYSISCHHLHPHHTNRCVYKKCFISYYYVYIYC